MKKYLFLIVMFAFGWQTAFYAQSKKMTKAEREAAWRAERLKKKAAEERREHLEDSVAFVQAVEALRSGSWALEASNVTFNNGVTRFVTESTNYVSINGGEGTVQTAFNNSNVYSPNGLGGVTLEGRVSGERMSQDNAGNIFYSYTIMGSNFSAMVYVTLAAHTNQATARIDPNFSGQTMTMSGYIYPYDSAGVFEGTASYY
ncbi:MAG: DUF4251 domain-containing protein [Bacteroidaceae bacterium]|nr:DUF4251 domain-containing protein [Bacteroidaceae bacterium]MBR3856049.1 DUF4251 domain-containing protein [Bacteroidaceae bacterium]